MKKIIFALLLIFSISSVFSLERTFTQNENQEFILDIYDAYGTDASYKRNKLTSLNKNNLQSTSNKYTYIFNKNSKKSQQVFSYPKNNKNYLPRPRAIDLGVSQSNNVEFYRYQNSVFASNYKCNPKITTLKQNTLSITSNLQTLKVWSKHTGSWVLHPIDISSLNENDKTHFENRMEDYYYLKTKLYINAKTDRGGQEKNFIINEIIKDVLIKPNTNQVNIDIAKIELELKNKVLKDNPNVFGNIKYDINVRLVPVDLKCDLSEDGRLETLQISSDLPEIYISNEDFQNLNFNIIKKPKFENFETTLSDEIIPKNYINDNEKLNNKIGISEGDNLYFNGEKISSFPMSETVK